MVEQIHKGDIGTVFEVTMYDELGNIVDLSTATIMNILWKRRDGIGTLITNSAYLKTDGTDGIMVYKTTVASELDYIGKWQRQGYVETPSGNWHSDIKEFIVYSNL